jgi:shikimate dehydrogenase
MSKLALGVLGENISYTLSPRIFEWAFREAGVEGEYRVFDLPLDKVRDFLTQHRDWDGLNVTTPYKQMAYENCANLSAEAVATQAVNTIQRGREGLEGFNTDVAGFRSALERLVGEDFHPRNTLVIGSGGAARAVMLGLSAKHRNVRMEATSRDIEKAGKQLDSLFQMFPSHSCLDLETASHFLRDFDLVIQASPVGGANLPGCPLREPLKFKVGAVVIDLIYAPRKTRFLDYAEQSGARIQNGLPMLIAQAAESFRILTGFAFPLEKAMKNLLPELAAA